MSADTLSGSCCRTNFFAAVCTRYVLPRPWSRPSLKSTTRRISPSGVPSRTSSPGRSMSTSVEMNHFLVNVNYQICLTPPTRRRSTFLSVVCDRSLLWHLTTDVWSRHLPVMTPGKETPTSTHPPGAEPPALPSDLEDDLPVNAYEPDSKKARAAEDDQLLHELKSSTSSTTTKESRDYDLHWLQELQQQEGDLHHLFMQCEDVMQIELDVDLPSHRQQKSFESNASAFMVKKMRDSEVVLAKLSNELRELFNRAKSKEVSSFIKAEAVRKALSDEEVRKAFGSGPIMRARWVLTWKLTPPEDRPSAKPPPTRNLHTPRMDFAKPKHA